MSTAMLERLPNTVTRCHEEIRRLREASADDSADRIAELEAERDELKNENEALGDRVDELEGNEHPDAIAAIDQFLDEVERVGPLRFDVPQTDGVNRAIVALHDAAGRRP